MPVLASSEKIVGQDTRLLSALVDAQGEPIADAPLKLNFQRPAGAVEHEIG